MERRRRSTGVARRPTGAPAILLALLATLLLGPAAATAAGADTVDAPAVSSTTLLGVVTDPTGPLAGSVLTLSGSSLADPVVATTGANGAYAFPDLAPGDDYVLEVDAPVGHVDQVVSEIELGLRPETLLDLVVSPEAVEAGDGVIVGPLPSGSGQVHYDATHDRVLLADQGLTIYDGDLRILRRVAPFSTFHGLTALGSDAVMIRGRDVDWDLVHVDLASLEVVRTWSPQGYWGTPRDGASGVLRTAGGRLWWDSPLGLLALDPTTEAVVPPGPQLRSARRPAVIADAPNQLLAQTESAIQRWDVETLPATLLASYPTWNAPIGASLAADRVWSVDGEEWVLSTGADTGVDRGVLSAVGEHLAGGRDGAVGSVGTLVGPAAPTHWLGPSTPGAFTPGDESLIAVSGTAIERWDLEPRVTDASPATVIAGVPTEMTISGSGLGGVVDVTLGGLPAEITEQSPHELSLIVHPPSTLGPATLSLAASYGVATETVTVAANTGAQLGGTVRGQGATLAGIEVTVSSASLGDSVTTTTGPDGTWSVTGRPYATDHRVALHDPSGAFVDQRIGAVVLVPNGSAALDADLSPSSPLAEGDIRSVLGVDGTVSQILPLADGWFAATAGNEVLLIDADVRLRARVRTPVPWGSELYELDGAVWLRTGTEVARIDRGIAAVTEVVDLPFPLLDTDIVAASGRFWAMTTSGDVTTLRSFDPVTEVEGTPFPLPCRCTASPVVGSNELFVGSEDGMWVLDVEGAPTIVRSSSTPLVGFDAVASAALGDAWTDHGERVDLEALTVAQQLPTVGGSGDLAVSTDGRAVWLGDGEVRLAATGSPLLPDTASHAAFLLGRPGVVRANGAQLSVTWLLPQVDDVDPRWVAPNADTTIEITGQVLGAVTEVTVAGAPVAVTVIDRLRISLAVPAAALQGPIGATVPIEITTAFGDVHLADSVRLGTSTPGPPLEVELHLWELVPFRGPVVASWRAPYDDGGLPVTTYELRVVGTGRVGRVDPTPLWWPHDETLIATWLTGPADGEPFAIEVRAVNADGAGPWVQSPTVTPSPVTPYFSDVPADQPFFGEIQLARYRDLAEGYPDETFRPSAVVSRQAAVAFLWRMAGSPTTGEDDGPFPDPGFADVAPTHPFRTAISWAAAEGIVAGYPDGTFRGGADVTRQAWVAFQWRAAGEPPGADGCTASFTDVGPTHPFGAPILWAACEGITTGYSDGTFRPSATVTRQAAVAFLMRPTWPQWEPILAP